jgi:hypothetical protein
VPVVNNQIARKEDLNPQPGPELRALCTQPAHHCTMVKLVPINALVVIDRQLPDCRQPLPYRDYGRVARQNEAARAADAAACEMQAFETVV